MIYKSELESLDYADVVILPKQTNVYSRDSVNLYMKNKVHHPIFCSPMRGIASPELIVHLGYLGGVGILHRFFEDEADRYNAIEYIGQFSYPFGISVGINNWEDELKLVDFAYALGVNYVCVDSANAHNKRVIDATYALCEHRNQHNMDFEVISGNVVTFEGAMELAKTGVDFMRIGIGNGWLCSTSNYTSIGMPSLTAIQECSRAKLYYPVKIIADGGVKSSGEAMKAFIWGSDAVMCGSLFGKALEANNGGVMYGMSSSRLQAEMGKQIKSNEGLVKEIPEDELRPLKEIYDELTYGLRSGLSYLNVEDINKIHQADIQYIEVGRNTLKNL
jgi:IMP dehydrogenase